MSNEIRTYTLTPDAYLYHADCSDVLRALPENSLDSCVCDPPYHLTSVVKRFGGANAAPAKHGTDGLYARQSRGFMQTTWDGGDIAFRPETWALVLRVLKPGAHLVAFGAPRGYHRMACAIEDAGFEIRDSLIYLFGTGFPKSQNVSAFVDRELGAKREVLERRKAAVGFDTEQQGGGGWSAGEIVITKPATPEAAEWEGWGTALKPAFEPIVLARKPLSEPTVAANVLRWRTGALNIDACRVGSEEIKIHGYKGNSFSQSYKDAGTQPELNEYKTATGRWPANVVTDGSAEVIEAFPQTGKSHPRNEGSIRTNQIYGKDNNPRTFHPGFADESTSAARFFFNTSESDEQWLGRNLRSNGVQHVEGCSSLSSELAVFVLSRAVVQSMPRLVLTYTGSPEHFTNVTAKELRQISDTVTEMILNLDGRCAPESLPLKHTRSDNLANIAAVRTQIDTITITINRLKLNGCVAPATFNITLPNSEHGEKDSASRIHYSAKANKTDRAGSKHPTIKPVALMEWLCRLVTPKGGVILDPFAGSGTTGAAALRNGFRCVLCEREVEYVQDIIRRIGALENASAA